MDKISKYTNKLIYYKNHENDDLLTKYKISKYNHKLYLIQKGGVITGQNGGNDENGKTGKRKITEITEESKQHKRIKIENQILKNKINEEITRVVTEHGDEIQNGETNKSTIDYYIETIIDNFFSSINNISREVILQEDVYNYMIYNFNILDMTAPIALYLKNTKNIKNINIREIMTSSSKYFDNIKKLYIETYAIKYHNITKRVEPLILMYRITSCGNETGLEFCDEENVILHDCKIDELLKIYGILYHNKYDDIINIHIKIIESIIHVKSSSAGERNMKLREYLSTSKGKNGQIIGFSEYVYKNINVACDKNIEKTGNILNTFANFTNNADGFTRTTTEYFITKEIDETDLLDTDYRYEFVNVGNFIRADEEYKNDIDPNLDYEEGKIKKFNAGTAMPDPNNFEVNYVGDFYLKGYRIVFPKDIKSNIKCFAFAFVLNILSEYFIKEKNRLYKPLMKTPIDDYQSMNVNGVVDDIREILK